LYRSTASPLRFVSVFVQRVPEKPTFDAGKLVVLQGPDAQHHVLGWRGEKLVYYLIADVVADADNAAGAYGWSSGN
jgi:hypothetical protein